MTNFSLRGALVGALLVLAPTPSAALAGEAGCPFTWSAPATDPALLDRVPVPDVEAGPFDGVQQRLQSVSFEIEPDGRYAIGVGVEEMRRATRAGMRWTYWEVQFDVSTRLGDNTGTIVRIFYDILLDEFTTFASVSNYSARPEGTVEAREGKGGGVTVRYKLSDLQLQRGNKLVDVTVDAGDFVSFPSTTEPGSPRTTPYGYYSPRVRMAGPPSLPVLRCPDLTFTARDLGFGRGATLSGDVMPAGSRVVLEALDGVGWGALGEVKSGSTGAYSFTAPLPPGQHTVRSVATTLSGTTVTSAAAVVTVTG